MNDDVRHPAHLSVQIVEVGPRDGFQAINTIIPLPIKSRLSDDYGRQGYVASKLGHSSVALFFPKWRTLRKCSLMSLICRISIPKYWYPRSGMPRLRWTLGSTLGFRAIVSEQHNMSNVRRTPRDSV